MNTLEILSPVISTLFGGAGVITFIGARRERKAQAKLVESEANLKESEANLKETEVFSSWQQIYTKLVADTDKKFNEFEREIDSLKRKLSDYESRCKFCDKK